MELERLAEESGIAYENNLALRALVSIIPGVGSSLDMVLADGGRRYRERIFRALEDMSVDMKERLETIEESAFDKKFLTTIKSRDDTKRRIGARILTESAILSSGEHYSPEEYLDLVADLTPRELTVAQALYKEQTERAYEDLQFDEARHAWRAWRDEVRDKASVDGADLQLILGRLHSLGLIVEDTALFPSGGVPAAGPPMYWMSPAFKKLMRFLNRRDA